MKKPQHQVDSDDNGHRVVRVNSVGQAFEIATYTDKYIALQVANVLNVHALTEVR